MNSIHLPFNLSMPAEWLPSESGWNALTYAVTLYGGRYLIVALVFSFIVAMRWGSPLREKTTPDLRMHVTREILFSAVAILIFGLVNMGLFGYGLIAHSQMYWRISDYGWTWFAVSIVLLIALHDTFFYWLHRAMHTRLLFRTTHLTHHLSLHPTPWTAYSLHPSEALMEALIVTVLIFILPVHPLAMLAFQSISTLINVYGHCGREFYPDDWHRHPIGRWINTSRTHAHHHATGRHNYSFYFLFWDRLMGTLAPEHDDRISTASSNKTVSMA